MSNRYRHQGEGPFKTEQIRSGDPYELSQGHPIWCAPTGTDGTGPNGLGFAVLDSDPAVHNAGVDTGIELAKNTLRAPDVAVNFERTDGTWAKSAPLALEYAGKGQDEAELRLKIRELLAGGTRWVWVVRLTGPRRVEVHEADGPVRVLNVDDTLTAPGVLALPVPVRSLFERDAAHEVTLRNLLAAKGYANLNAVREEGIEKGIEKGIEAGVEQGLRDGVIAAITARGWSLDAERAARVAACRETATLTRWISRAVTAPSLAAVFDEA